MGGCIGKAPPEAAAPAAASKRYDVFVSHHQGVGMDGDSGDFSQHFAQWVAEVSEGLGLSVYMDKTNLARIMDDRISLKEAIFASRAMVGIISAEGWADPNGMQQEMWWAHSARVPILPFYDSDLHSTQDCAKWRRDFPFAFQHTPIMYQRRGHMQAKGALVAALQSVLMESYNGQLPEKVAERMSRQTERQRRREKRAERLATQSADGSVDSADDSNPLPATGLKEEPRKHSDSKALTAVSDSKQVHIRFSAEVDTQDIPEAGREQSLPADGASGADKRFRFRDEELAGASGADSARGVGRLLKSLRDPLGRKEQEQRVFALTEGGGAEVGEVHFVPRHRELTAGRSILRGSRAAAGDTPGSLAPSPIVAMAALDPKVQKGVKRLTEYLEGVSKDDVGQLPTVLRVLQLMAPNLSVVIKALAVVFEFVQDVAKCRQVVAQQGGIKDIVTSMSAYAQSIDVQTYGCGCLYALSCFRADNPEKDNNSAAIAHAGGIARIIEAMATYPACREIQQWGAGALRYLAVEIGTNRREISDGGEVQLTMRGINKRMIAKLGGIEQLVRAMLKFSDDPEVQENGCAALCNLLSNRQDTKVRAARAGCIRAAVTTLGTFNDDPELAQLACALLRGLALGVPENKIAIVAQGGVRQLCRAMARHRGDAEVNIQAVAALCNLTSQVSENKRVICEAGGLELAVAALRSMPEDAELQQQGCGLLHNLACERSLFSQVLAAGALQVAEAASKHSQRTVQSLGQMLQRQLQPDARGGTTAAATSAREGSAAAGAESRPAEGAGNDGGVDGLFAPRRPGSAATGGGRNKALTRPQRKVMADVLDSMKKDPNDWLPTSDSEASGDEARSRSARRRRGDASSPRSEASSGGGRWDQSRRRQAATYGIEDLEGMSDYSANEQAAGAFDFIVQRGNRSKGEGTSARSQGSNSELDFIVARRGKRSTGSDASESASEAGSAAERTTRGEDDAAQVDAPQPQKAQASEDIQDDADHGAGVMPHRRQDDATKAAVEGPPAVHPQAKQPPMTSGRPLERDSDAVSQVSSEQSEGGWIDLFEDETAGRRIQRRANRDQRRDRRFQKPEQINEGALMLQDLLGEVELEDVPVTVPRVRARRSRSQAKFARSLRRVADAPPERWEDDWKQALMHRYEQGQKSFATRGAKALVTSSADAATTVLNSLDGVGKVAKKRIDKGRDVAAKGVRRRVENAERLRNRLREEGLVQMVQNSKLGRRALYGLDDDEDSIYDLEELQELGQAEVALLDAIGGADEAAAYAAQHSELPAAEGSTGPTAATAPAAAPLHRELGAAKLEALSARLASRRDERRRVKLL